MTITEQIQADAAKLRAENGIVTVRMTAYLKIQPCPSYAFTGHSNQHASNRGERKKMTIKRPTPKELVIKDLGHLCITATTNDARQWIEQEGSTFGHLYKPDFFPFYRLFIGDEYDHDEVIAYLNSYNNEAAK